MRVYVAGASGVLGVHLVPLLVEAGHVVAGMTRSPEKTDRLASLGAEPVCVDVYDVPALTAAVVGFAPDAVVDELTDLPDDPARIADFGAANNRIRREGTRNLLAAAATAGAWRFVAQSVAWELPGEGAAAVLDHEAAVLEAGGVVVRYGRFYGPGTYAETDRGGSLPEPPRIHVAEAARQTLPALFAEPKTVLTIAEE